MGFFRDLYRLYEEILGVAPEKNKTGEDGESEVTKYDYYEAYLTNFIIQGKNHFINESELMRKRGHGYLRGLPDWTNYDFVEVPPVPSGAVDLEALEERCHAQAKYEDDMTFYKYFYEYIDRFPYGDVSYNQRTQLKNFVEYEEAVCKSYKQEDEEDELDY